LTSGPCWFLSKELFQKSLNGVGKEKKLYMPLKESCVVFIIWEHIIVVFSFDALFGLTWRMLTTCFTLTSRHKPL
jgi:hypothetical protein